MRTFLKGKNMSAPIQANPANAATEVVTDNLPDPKQAKLKKSKKKSGKKEKAPLKVENYERDLKISRNQMDFNLVRPHSYSVALSGGYGFQSFNNNEGLDHHGFQGRLAAGLRLAKGLDRQHVFLPRLFYGFQDMHRTIGTVFKSRAQVHRVGAEINYLNEVYPTWLQAGGYGRMGAAIYRAKEGDFTGAYYNESQTKYGAANFREMNSSALHLALGAQACTFNGLACLYGGYGGDLGLKFNLEGVNTHGAELGVTFDFMRLFTWNTPKRVKKNYEAVLNKPATEVKLETKTPKTETPKKEPAPAPQTEEPAKPEAETTIHEITYETGSIAFHENGLVSRGRLVKDTVINGTEFAGDTTVILDKEGKVISGSPTGNPIE